MKDLRFITKILHTKYLREDSHGSLHMPVYDNVTFEFKTAEDLELAFQGKKPSHMYSRISNPTIEHFEQRIKSVTGAVGVLALSSGMAAISNTFLTIAKAQDNIITSKHLFGNTYSLFEYTLRDWGLETRYTDLTKPDQVARLIDHKTKAIFLETITNPQLEVADIKALSEIAKAKNILLIADTTLTPPYLFSAREFGVDIETLSSTKWISGGATSVGGLIIDHGLYDWKQNEKLRRDVNKYGPFTFMTRLRREVYRNIGACMSPHNAYLQSLGLETLALRLDQACVNTLKIAGFLKESSHVSSVNYPGLRDSIYYEIAGKQFGEKSGALLTFDLTSKNQCFKFMNKLQLIRRATNLHDNKTLIIHPASTIFCEYDDKLKQEMGVRDTMLRLAVGIEDSRDLITDIQQALEG
ncbi:MAG: O-acetylhomoserine sulfhydrylase [Omnitrophica bacterium RIFCSPLOWO2_12_FULL_44_17]|uniref:O-acetylhomoserine sulfhydrylase n=1 Tax=Candidatus Danuiimicrobium aquiferis TaxID=1801832 RepID=A0A1G1KQP6_9BACT|nr:MAG: O-acetylhomoserine sulfhydrylase [Omnitrophica bacterium RIFCSPHIGHO2_02_FULL_45_28]OGW95270.1 MAG: O-acetylhomoserine sulfhydrylase [Omnitrophica bacterium RIFCSPLOWO2_12_FULL_44_17]